MQPEHVKPEVVGDLYADEQSRQGNDRMWREESERARVSFAARSGCSQTTSATIDRFASGRMWITSRFDGDRFG